MKSIALTTRNIKELLRDPLTYILAVFVPVLLLILFITINSRPGMEQIEVFKLKNLTPGIIVFGFSFIMMFLGMLLTRDRKSSFINRLFASPLKPSDYIIGYILPFFVIALFQMILILLVAVISGMAFTINVIGTLIVLIPISLFSICMGLIFGSILTEGQMGGVGSVFITVTQLFSGAWMDLEMIGGIFQKISYVLPFSHAINAARMIISGNYAGITEDFIWVITYTVISIIASILVFRKNIIA